MPCGEDSVKEQKWDIQGHIYRPKMMVAQARVVPMVE